MLCTLQICFLFQLVNKEDSMKNLLHTSTAFCRKNPNIKSSPKKKNLVQSRIYSRTHRFSSSKLYVSRRSSFDGSRISNVGAFEKILTRLKRYCTASRNWSAKVIEMCAQLGLQLKNVIGYSIFR